MRHFFIVKVAKSVRPVVNILDNCKTDRGSLSLLLLHGEANADDAADAVNLTGYRKSDAYAGCVHCANMNEYAECVQKHM